MKVKLLNDGGYEGLEVLHYSTIFEATVTCGGLGVDILIKDLIDAGAYVSLATLNRDDSSEGTLYFSNGTGVFPNEYQEIN